MEFLFFLAAWALGFAACGENSVIKPEYVVEFPALPEPWQELLGDAHWRLVWMDPQGMPRSLETDGEGHISIATVSEWATPALAYPYWPGKGILPGEMRPAGAVLPFDLAGGTLRLSWQGGVEAWFYRELAEARAAAGDAPDKRRPEYFDWPRFRALLQGDALPQDLRDDPWRVDWHEAAMGTIKSGFDRRRIKILATAELLVSPEALAEAAPESPGEGGPFAGPSPFAQPLLPEPGAGYRFIVGQRRDTYVSAKGILRASGKTWVYHGF